MIWHAYLLIFSVSFLSITKSDQLFALKLIHLSIIHSLSMSVSDSASNLPLLHSVSPSLSYSVVSALLSQYLLEELSEDKPKIPESSTSALKPEGLLNCDGQADEQSTRVQMVVI